MENVAGKQGLVVQKCFPYSSYNFLIKSNQYKISFFNTRGLKLGYFDILTCLSICGIL